MSCGASLLETDSSGSRKAWLWFTGKEWLNRIISTFSVVFYKQMCICNYIHIYTHINIIFFKKKTTTTTTDLQRGPLLVHRAPATQQSPTQSWPSQRSWRNRGHSDVSSPEMGNGSHQRWGILKGRDSGFKNQKLGLNRQNGEINQKKQSRQRKEGCTDRRCNPRFSGNKYMHHGSATLYPTMHGWFRGLHDQNQPWINPLLYPVPGLGWKASSSSHHGWVPEIHHSPTIHQKSM